MKELPFQGQGLLPLTLNVRILKLWNSTVCSAHSGPPSHYDTVSKRRGDGVIGGTVPVFQTYLKFRDLSSIDGPSRFGIDIQGESGLNDPRAGISSILPIPPLHLTNEIDFS